MDNLPKTKRDGCMQSLWQNVQPANEIKPYAGITYDVLIIGAGITGMTTALMLQKEGKRCLVCDAHTVGFGTTGGTSAHINTFADATYDQVEKDFGEEGAKLFAEAIKEGFDIISDNISTYNIDCDFEWKQGYVFAEEEKQMEQLQKMYEATRNAGVAAAMESNIPCPIPNLGGARFDGQAQFHPLKYLFALQKQFLKLGGIILENTRIDKVEKEGDIHIVSGYDVAIRATHVVYATHIPPGINLFSFRCAPYRSYVLAATLADGNYPDSLIYDMQDPYHYIRSHTVDGQQHLVAGGCDHKTGHDDPIAAFKELEAYVRRYYNVKEIAYKWSSQYYVPVDGLPYIGKNGDNTYCATGYNGNGMMLGSIAGRIIADTILERESKYADLFAPYRLKPIAGFVDFIKENADVVYQFVASRFSAEEAGSLKDIKPGEGELVETPNGKVAVYRGVNDELHLLNPVCTHAGCIVQWNGKEKSWDCPCHGARFDVDGNVLNGPADKNLEQYKL